MKKIVPVIVVLLVAGFGYKTTMAKPAEEAPKPKVEGKVYVLQKEFLVNLSDGRYAKLSVGFVMAPDDHSTVAEAGGGHGAAPPTPEGYGTMPQEAIVRDLITNELTDASAKDVISHEGREQLKRAILKDLQKSTDVHAEEVLFMDVTVQ